MSLRIAAGRYKGQKIATVSGPGYRPAMDKVRQALFSMLESRGVCWEEIRVLDLFAGSGSLGLEALSRGAQEAVFVEQSPKAVRALQETVARLQVPKSQCRLVARKVAGFLRQIPKQSFDLVFVDPPYGQNLLHSTLHALQSGNWLAQSALVAAELEAEMDVQSFMDLEQEVNRTYGQTRIVIWRMKSQRPRSTPERLIP